VSRRAALETLAHGLDLALTGVRQLLEEADPDEWVDQEASPLGRRRHCELARQGAFPSAHKVDGRWQVRRKDVDAYIEGHAAPAAKGDEDAAKEAAEIESFRAPVRRRRSAA